MDETRTPQYELLLYSNPNPFIRMCIVRLQAY